MPVLKNIAAIAKGMSITFMEMFQPTTVENYPDGKGPLKGARFEARFRGAHVLQRDENGLEKGGARCIGATGLRIPALPENRPPKSMTSSVLLRFWASACNFTERFSCW
jgi:hypothetical protein